MPTVILLDVSLSMARPSCVPQCACPCHGDVTPSASQIANEMSQSSSTHTSVIKKTLAAHSICRFLDKLGQQAKLEYVSLVIYSSLWEIAVPFTRDYDLIKSAVDSVKLYDKTCLDAAFSAGLEVILSSWGNTSPCKVVLVTDGLFDVSSDVYEKITSISYPFPCDFHLFCLSSANEIQNKNSISQLNNMMAAVGGSMSVVEDSNSIKSVYEMVDKYVEEMYKVYSGVLHCGNLTSKVQLYPSPTNAVREDDFTCEELEFPHQLHVVGFISQAQIKSPACISRHLVLPLTETANASEEEKQEEKKAPAFTVLLHGALKVESHVALVKISNEWYGMMHSMADSKKKSNLVLSVFSPGLYSVPWLGSFKLLDCISPSEAASGATSGLPIPVTVKKSYSSNSSSWLRQATLQADVQKLLRYGKKLPEKLNVFYKELNRIHKAAVSTGFHSLLTGLSQILERECALLPSTAHPDASIQLQHAASLLCKKEVANVSYIIRPLQTNYQTDKA